MSELTHKQQALAAKEFSQSLFGAHFLQTFRDSKDHYLRVAMNAASTVEQKALVVERAAGVDEVLSWIDDLCTLADNPELLNDKEDEKEEDGDVEG